MEYYSLRKNETFGINSSSIHYFRQCSVYTDLQKYNRIQILPALSMCILTVGHIGLTNIGHARGHSEMTVTIYHHCSCLSEVHVMHVTVQLILMYLFYFINLLTSLTNWYMQQLVSRTCCMHIPSRTMRDISKITDLATPVQVHVQTL